MDYKQVLIYLSVVFSLIFHLHRVTGFEIIPGADMIELGGGVAFAIICIALFIQKRRQQERRRQDLRQGARMQDGFESSEPISGAGAGDQLGGAVNKANTPLNIASIVLPLTNILSVILFGLNNSSKGKSRRLRGGKKHSKRSRSSRRSRSQSRRRRRSNKH